MSEIAVRQAPAAEAVEEQDGVLQKINENGRVPFGKEMAGLFLFEEGWRNMNHGLWKNSFCWFERV